MAVYHKVLTYLLESCFSSSFFDNVFDLFRFELFMEAFSHISNIIDKIYKQLTKSSTHPLGGTAYLNLENEDDPFLHGIKYTAMPPTKRFRDMEQLSGGEKTVAALALLFSIHRYAGRDEWATYAVEILFSNAIVHPVANFNICVLFLRGVCMWISLVLKVGN